MSKQIKVELQGVFANDRTIAESAWTSSTLNGKKSLRTDDDVTRIVNMLADSGHSTPFESVVFRFWIKMPISADRQFMTHRLQSANGLSGRYRTMPADWQDVPQDVRDILVKLDSDVLCMEYERYCQEANEWYQKALTYFKRFEKLGDISNSEYKRLREFFRGVLPQNNMTERTTTMNLRSFANFIRLRNSEHAQPEIRQVAKLMLEAVEQSNSCPVAIAALKRNEWRI